jgi:CheY-like chemotaxis protein
MDAATLERIFDAFYTTKPQGEGTGLGLSMVHGTMRSHGGAVTVESTPGKGSSFHLYFPAEKEKVKKEEVGAPAQSLPGGGQRVLYVDDEEALVFLAERVLSRLGHSVSGFTDPGEALAAFRAHPQDFDVVVTDLSMPHMSGFELAREVLGLRPGMPVLMTSGYVRAEDELAARAAGIRELILKPVTMDELGSVLDRLFRSDEPNGLQSA